MRKSYLDESEILISGTCNIFSGLGSKKTFHMHRQIEIMYAINDMCKVYMPDKEIDLKPNQFIVLKPFELHDYSSKGHLFKTYISPIFPSIISDKLSNYIKESTVYSDTSGEILQIMKTYPYFNCLSPELRLIYFENLEKIVYKYIKPDKPTIHPIILFIQNNSRDSLTLDSIAKACYSNRCTVSKVVNSYSGVNFNVFINKIRLSDFVELYSKDKSLGIEKTAEKVGFTAKRTFYRVFQNEFNMTPTAYFNIIQNKTS